MTYRISEKDLLEIISDFCNETGVKFQLHCVYGAYGVQIRLPNSAGCVSDFIGLGTKKETFEKLQTIRRFFCNTDSRFNRDKVALCQHRDSLNRYEGKKNVSVINHYTEKKRGKELDVFYCCGCGKTDLTQKDLKKSEIPITYRGLRTQIEKAVKEAEQ